MRKWPIALLLLAAGCGSAPSTNDMKEIAGPDVSVKAVPGIALDYNYTFRVPARAIAATQERHAALCEALGAGRCRVAGMEYHAGSRDSLSGSLSLKLSPDIAYRYVRRSTAVVTDAGGMLIDAQIASQEAGRDAASAERDAAAAEAEKRRIASQMARSGLPAAERVTLQQRAAELSDLQRASVATRDASAALLASTPVRFVYTPGEASASLHDGPVLAAAKDGLTGLVDSALFLMKLLATLLPWVVVIALIWLGWRRYAARQRTSEDD